MMQEEVPPVLLNKLWFRVSLQVETESLCLKGCFSVQEVLFLLPPLSHGPSAPPATFCSDIVCLDFLLVGFPGGLAVPLLLALCWQASRSGCSGSSCASLARLTIMKRSMP